MAKGDAAVCGRVSLRQPGAEVGHRGGKRLLRIPVEQRQRREIEDLQRRYAERKRATGVMDFDDLLVKTVAEGIETEEQAEYMVNLKCHFGQGFLLSKPMETQSVEDYLKTNSVEER